MGWFDSSARHRVVAVGLRWRNPRRKRRMTVRQIVFMVVTMLCAVGCMEDGPVEVEGTSEISSRAGADSCLVQAAFSEVERQFSALGLDGINGDMESSYDDTFNCFTEYRDCVEVKCCCWYSLYPGDPPNCTCQVIRSWICDWGPIDEQ